MLPLLCAVAAAARVLAAVVAAGNVKAEDRRSIWEQEHMRIFFATPQTFWNDVKKGGTLGCCADPHGACHSCNSGTARASRGAGLCHNWPAPSTLFVSATNTGSSSLLQACVPMTRWCASSWTSATAPQVGVWFLCLLGPSSCWSWRRDGATQISCNRYTAGAAVQGPPVPTQPDLSGEPCPQATTTL